MKNDITSELPQKKPNITSLFRLYIKPLGLLVFLSVASSGLGLILPKIIAKSIDAYIGQSFSMGVLLSEFGGISLLIFATIYLQGIIQTLVSERVARDLREKLSDKISRQDNAFIEDVSAAKLLTNLTADVDSIKMFVSMAIASIVSSIIVIVGASVLLLLIDWELALAVLIIVPLLATTFFLLFKRANALFKERQEVIDWLNRVINESILGAGIVRVLHSEKSEQEKFSGANLGAKDIGVRILKIFASLIPLVTFIANLAVLVILVLGGHFVITDAMSLGDFAAFNSYVILLIFPIIMIGFMSNVIAQATASYGRIAEILEAKENAPDGTLRNELGGDVEVENVTLHYNEKPVLRDISFKIPAGSKVAIIGPTAAGKTQLLHLLIGLIRPAEGAIRYDGHELKDYDPETLHRQVGLVFQDSVIFNLSLRENIAFSQDVKEEAMEKALKAAELDDFIAGLPEGLETIVSERGSSLSGGQKQRIMLARSLALDPKVLLLDDFTARVDNRTEKSILDNIAKMYPDLTLVSVTQKISSVEKYDRIILLMEGEVIAMGTHQDLLERSPEYVQIYDSQKSTNEYE